MKELTPKTVIKRTRPAAIYIGSNGQWVLNPALITKAGVSPKDKIKLLFDDDNRLYLTRCEDGFSVCAKVQRYRTVMAFTSMKLRDQVFDTIGIYNSSMTFKIKPEPVIKTEYPNPLFELDTNVV